MKNKIPPNPAMKITGKKTHHQDMEVYTASFKTNKTSTDITTIEKMMDVTSLR